ncbi:MAG: GTPase [Ignavibacteria bacterium]|nr:GTPase [Ignavibacteria bacterium]
MDKIKVLIMGAAGRDFHNFNVVYRDNMRYNVVAFTATQIPYIDDRKYPAALCGKLYPNGIPIYPETDLISLIKKHKVDEVVFSYSDVNFQYVMSKAALVNAAGAAFVMLGGEQTMVKSSKPVIAVVANRTGSGKSQTSRKVIEILMSLGKKAVAVRHPMPYGDLVKQKVQRFAKISDLKNYAGVDYEAILRQAEKEADVVVWDGGNNDLPFYKPDLVITVTDPHRPGHELNYYPGMTNLIIADVVVLNKIDSANPENIEIVRNNILKYNNNAAIVEAASPISLENPDDIRYIKGKRVLVVEDGPTLTHGEMKFGAGVIAARKFGAKEIVDPRKYAVKSIAETYAKYPNIGTLLPAMGYGDRQIKDLETTINRVPCDAVLIGTPIDLRRLVKIKKPAPRVVYNLQEIGKPDLYDIISAMLKKKR